MVRSSPRYHPLDFANSMTYLYTNITSDNTGGQTPTLSYFRRISSTYGRASGSLIRPFNLSRVLSLLAHPIVPTPLGRKIQATVLVRPFVAITIK
ncbi:hypothetical protein D9613_008683 [Agrocybe pediades]|uniref:Uncharacterized protein n=1 Tax=Agrocybe pediades TaxID=84607 RepID=A0A8H4VQY8_9AGAR|nr:hypothetical protein D9613_008683 [Agrocybe pediades]